jgi:hypothetical protein
MLAARGRLSRSVDREFLRVFRPVGVGGVSDRVIGDRRGFVFDTRDPGRGAMAARRMCLRIVRP